MYFSQILKICIFPKFSKFVLFQNLLLLCNNDRIFLVISLIFSRFSFFQNFQNYLYFSKIFKFGISSTFSKFVFFQKSFSFILNTDIIFIVFSLRYYAIAAPLHYAALVSSRRVGIGLAASWTGALFLCLPPFSGIVPPYKYSQGLGCCVPDFGNGTWGTAATIYGAIYVLLGLALPAILVTICNCRVLSIARYHRHRIASAIYEVTLSAQVTITHQRNPFFVPTVTSPAAGGPPRFHSAASTVRILFSKFSDSQKIINFLRILILFEKHSIFLIFKLSYLQFVKFAKLSDLKLAKFSY